MNTPPTRHCSTCGAAASPDQRFCHNCGTAFDQETTNPTVSIGEANPTQYSGSPTPPPPPDMDQYATLRQQPGTGYTPPPAGGFSYHQQPTEGSFASPYADPTAPQSPASYPPPIYTAPQKDNTKKILGGIGCGMLSIILVALLICGGASYFVYTLVIRSASTTTGTGSTTYSGDTGGNTVTPTIAPASAKTVPLGLKIKYSAIDYTIVDIKQAAQFSGDSSSSAASILRVDLHEVNATNNSIIFAYSDGVRLILPNQSSVAPQDYKQISPPANGASQDNWWDFPLPAGTAIDHLVLRFGTPQEAQMDVPLVAGTDLTKYQDVTVKPNTATTYAEMKWTLTSATLGWSAYNKQADSGKRYVTVNFNIDNPSAQNKNGYWGDYLRLQAGNATSAPDSNATIPTSFAAGSSGATGSANFLVPEGTHTFTLVLLADKIETGSPQATINFHIP